jgi:hypothetical protein
MTTMTSRISRLLQREFIEGTIFRVDLDRVDVTPDGSSGILRSLPLTGDRDKIKPGDPVKILTVAGERVALAGDLALSDTLETVVQDAGEVELAEMFQNWSGGSAPNGMETGGIPIEYSGNQQLSEDFSGTAGNGPYLLSNVFYAGTLYVYLNGLLARKTEIVEGEDSQSFSFNIPGRTISATDQITAIYQAGSAIFSTTDADTVDGYHAAESGADAHVVATNASGNLAVSGTLTAGSTLILPQNGNITGAVCGFDYMIDGGGVVVTAGDKGFVLLPFGMHVTNIETLANLSGSINCTVYKATYANYGTWTQMATSIGTSSALKNSQAVNFDFNAQEIMYVNVNSCSAAVRFTLCFRGYRI